TPAPFVATAARERRDQHDRSRHPHYAQQTQRFQRAAQRRTIGSIALHVLLLLPHASKLRLTRRVTSQENPGRLGSPTKNALTSGAMTTETNTDSRVDLRAIEQAAARLTGAAAENVLRWGLEH